MTSVSKHSTHLTKVWYNNLTRGNVVLLGTNPLDGNGQANAFVVLDIVSFDDDTLLLLGVGRKIDPIANRAFDVAITDETSLKLAGIPVPISFSANHTRIVSVHHEGFKLRSGCSPVIGRLTDADYMRLQATRSYQWSQADRLTLHEVHGLWRNETEVREKANSNVTLSELLLSADDLECQQSVFEVVSIAAV
ncbi:hypothetical protein [uncultured Cohaesibacter sp.]|uniref:hypothetical protein n=1 Tax=uncultured Cohaesibacter sp. TaxID=1002546 RepID=UPI0029C948B1|nr:hypothetical protein [uncultured Cohaesibacter sp.]